MSDNEILKALLSRAASGDDTAFEALVREFERPVYAIALDMLGDREDALDASQEVFVKLWQSRAKFRGECSVATWVTKLTRNTVCDMLRKRKNHTTESLDGDDDAPREIPDTDTSTDPVASYERRERGDEVRRALASLPRGQSEILILRDINRHSYAEIAELLGIDEGTVKSRLHRARISLKEILEKRNIFG